MKQYYAWEIHDKYARYWTKEYSVIGRVYRDDPLQKQAEHYDKHVIRQKEFGNISQSKYLKLAKEFSQEKNDRFQDKIVKNTLIRFDPQTGRVFVGHLKKKEIRTFYIDDGKGNNPFETAMYKVGI